MPYPTVRGARANPSSGDVYLPLNVGAGDTLLIFAAQADGTYLNPPSGWTDLAHNFDDGDRLAAIFMKKAAGTEGGTHVDWDSDSSKNGGYVVMSIMDAADPTVTPPTVSAAATGSSLYPAPPNCNPAASKEYLWIVSDHNYRRQPIAWPDDVPDRHYSGGETGLGNAWVATCTRDLTAASYDPTGTFTLATAAASWLCWTVAVHPVSTDDDAAPDGLQTHSAFPAPTLRYGSSLSPACLQTSSRFPELAAARVTPSCLYTSARFPRPTIQSGWTSGHWTVYVERSRVMIAER